MKRLSHLEWKVPYAPGTLEARGKRNGQVVLTEKRETTGAPATLRLTADRTSINADGEDLAILRVAALDAQGREVPTADAMVHFKITGAGRFLGVGNGDPNCQESDIKPQRSLFNGLAQLIVQATKTPGTITIEASGEVPYGPKLPATTFTVATTRATSRTSL
jgi:beta-galactosidase